MSVKNRLIDFIHFKEMTVRDFEKSINSSNGYVNSISKSIGIDKINSIIEKYPNINIDWLFTGRGEMLKSYNEKTNILPLNNDLPKDCVELKNKYIKLLEEYNQLLKSKLNGDPSTDKSVS
ncbi:hypothetical protein CHU00_17470 [Sphingobacterium cellulitidis]|uniref:hypothetical protein n=1 Tax=Sphingobacterium cellulitidis TaxID=1768011 RepID=UPI000B93DE30|nr:hypothetical protein [Sphingobacterium cellulitidis]OYD44298.1 hypothetical protein CHU00_17470 [Sphingobacterium cellulitidis]